MCNLSQGILERGEARGRAMGESIGEAKIIFKMYKNGFTLEQIADVTDKGIEEIKAIIDKDGSVLEQ
jgi:predicted transposase YdaD